MPRDVTMISERQASWRTFKAVSLAVFWMAVGALPSWHFATEHTRLEAYEHDGNVQVVAMSDLGNSVPVPNRVAENIIAKAARNIK